MADSGMSYINFPAMLRIQIYMWLMSFFLLNSYPYLGLFSLRPRATAGEHVVWNVPLGTYKNLTSD
jgi:hypothetical protein